MRSFVVAALVCVLLGGLIPGTAGAVGLYAVGKEDCSCSPLTVRGIVPDTLNKIHEALFFPQVAGMLDRVAMNIKAAADQGNGMTTAALSESPGVSEEAPAPKEEKQLKKAPAEKKTKPQAKVSKDKPKKKKKVKVPTRAL
jgi:hypothetical protein